MTSGQTDMTNQCILQALAFSFFIFVVAEIIGAVASNSLSLLGDAAAMSVDVFTVTTTYLTLLCYLDILAYFLSIFVTC